LGSWAAFRHIPVSETVIRTFLSFNRRFLNGMLHVLRAGCPWRDMHERYGLWKSVYVRFRRWAEQGVWDAILKLGLTDDWQHMIDSTTVRGHVSAAGAKGGLTRRLLVDHAVALRVRSTPAVTIRDALGFILTGGEASDYGAVDALMAIPVPKPKALLADKPVLSLSKGDMTGMPFAKTC
jgi:transposase